MLKAVCAAAFALVLLALMLVECSAVAAAQSHQKKKSDAKASTPSSASKRATAKAAKRKPPVQMAPTSERISQIQAALASRGAFRGDPTGRWDAASIDAMRQFQSSQGLNPSGKIDARTLQKLGLGSDTAGRGAPMARDTSPTAQSALPASPSAAAGMTSGAALLPSGTAARDDSGANAAAAK